MTTQSFDGWVEQHRRRLQFGLFLATAADWLAIFLLVLGAAVLTVKLFFPAGWPYILWAGLGAIPIAWIAWRKVGRNIFSRA